MLPSDKFILGDVLFVIVSVMNRRVMVTDIQDGTNCTFPPEITVQPVIVNFHVEEIEADE